MCFPLDCRQDADITFILDNSGSVGDRNYEQVKQFVVTLVQDLNVDQSRSHVAVITYSDNAKLEFNLDRYTNRRYFCIYHIHKTIKRAQLQAPI